MPSEPSFSGTVVLNYRWAIEQLFGAEVLDRALARIDPEVRERYETVTHLSWVPCDQVFLVQSAIAEEVGLSMRELDERAAPLSVERSLTTVWRVFLRLTSDEALFARAPLLYARSRSAGTLSARVLGPGAAELVVRGWPRMPERYASSLALGVAAVLRVAGRRAVRVDPSSTPDGARLIARWRP
jgi:hypothetical protein